MSSVSLTLILNIKLNIPFPCFCPTHIQADRLPLIYYVAKPFSCMSWMKASVWMVWGLSRFPEAGLAGLKKPHSKKKKRWVKQKCILGETMEPLTPLEKKFHIKVSYREIKRLSTEKMRRIQTILECWNDKKTNWSRECRKLFVACVWTT